MLFLWLLSSIFAIATAFPAFEPRQAPGACGNTADNRSAWCDDFDISTDYLNSVPEGTISEHWLEITNTTLAPDGISRIVLSINGTSPGPLIEANWGDTVVIHVTNSLSVNGTGIHWHGIRQNHTVQNDGVASITECPTAPGHTTTYRWRATQYGSSWYHSHYSLQAWEGVYGPMIIHGPATANYDEDVGMIALSDWSHETADYLYHSASVTGPPKMANVLINGMNTFNNSGTIVGSRYERGFTTGTRYRFRIVNVAIDTVFKFSIDNHTLTVIAADFVPIVPYETNHVTITMGQRYDFIITANQPEGDYWMRATPQASCSNMNNPENGKGIIRYSSSSTADPTSIGYTLADECVDELMTNLVPHVPHTIGSDADGTNDPLDVGVAKNSDGFFKWWMLGALNTSMLIEWSDPTLLQAYNNNMTFETNDTVIHLDNANEWVYYVIQTKLPVAHPIHLHGHDFYVLAQASAAEYSSSVSLNLVNPPRRDTVTLPASGYVVIAFYTDNPGAWLMHCHIGWHTSQGLALQFLERQSEIPELLSNDAATMSETCSTWSEFQKSIGLIEHDSGV